MKPIKHNLRTKAALIALALSSLHISASETYYRWIDPSGTPMSSDRPPPAGIEYEIITTETNTRVPMETGNDNASPTAAGAPVAAAGEQTQQTGRLVLEKNPEACAAARKNLETLNTHARIRISDDAGSYRYLDEDEKSAQRELAQAAITRNCE